MVNVGNVFDANGGQSSWIKFNGMNGDSVCKCVDGVCCYERVDSFFIDKQTFGRGASAVDDGEYVGNRLVITT
jgi:hypothetical protein